MKIPIFSPVLFIILTSNAESGDLVHPSLGAFKCDVVENKGAPRNTAIECPGIKINFDEDLTLNIICDQSNFLEHKLNELKGINIGSIFYLKITNCPLSNVTLKEFMKLFGATGDPVINLTDQISEFISFRNQSSIGFDDQYSVHTMRLKSCIQNTLPKDFFKGISNVQSIIIENNYLQSIHERTFSHTIVLKKLRLYKNDLKSLEPGVFKHLLLLQDLSLSKNNLKTLPPEVFTHLTNLKKLDLSINFIEYLSSDIFWNLKNLTELKLDLNTLKVLPPALFMGTTSLRELNLGNNDYILELPPSLISNLRILEKIDLGNCGIKTIPDFFFRYSSFITKVDLSRNLLALIPNEVFKNTPQLQVIDLSRNSISELPNDLFATSRLLKKVDISYNKLRTLSRAVFKGLSNLENLDLSDNGLDYVDPKTFEDLKNLIVIDLSNNSLKFINEPLEPFNSPLRFCAKLQYLELRHNLIESFFHDWTEDLPALRKLSLQWNRIQTIRMDTMLFKSRNVSIALEGNNISKVEFLDTFKLKLNEHYECKKNGSSSFRTEIGIGKAPLICDCNAYNFVKYIKNTTALDSCGIINFQIKGAICKSPPDMQDKRIAELDPQKLTCTLDRLVNVSLPRFFNCTSWFRNHSNTITVDCSNKSWTELPEEMPTIKGVAVSIELNMSHNGLVSLPKFFFSEHNITMIDVSHNRLQNVDDIRFPTKLQVLRLDNNQLTHLTENTLNIWKELENLSKISLHDNHWKCTCDIQHLRDFIHQSNLIEDLGGVRCWPNKEALEANIFCQWSVQTFIISCISAAIFFLQVALYYRYKKEIKILLYAHQMCLWFVTEEELDEDKIYDAFVSYSSRDCDFVEDILVPELESGSPQFRLCVHVRDWRAGDWIHDQIIRSVNESRRTLIVLSRNFLESDWSRMEFQVAHKQALRDKRARVILILYGNIGSLSNLDEEIKTYLSTNTYVEWEDPWFWEKLRYALPHSSKRLNNSSSAREARNIDAFHQAEGIQLNNIPKNII